jgi:hypothetical protein
VTTLAVALALVWATSEAEASAASGRGVARDSVLATAGAARKRATCMSGHTRYAKNGVRIFEIQRRFADLDGTYHVFLACRPGSRKPVTLDVSSFATFVKWKGAELKHGRVIWQVAHSAETSASVKLGWFSPRTGAHRAGIVDDEFGRPLATAVAGDGAIAIVVADLPSGSPDEVVAYMGLAGENLRAPRALATITGGGFEPGSLEIRDGQVTWATTAGVHGSAPIGG